MSDQPLSERLRALADEATANGYPTAGRNYLRLAAEAARLEAEHRALRSWADGIKTDMEALEAERDRLRSERDSFRHRAFGNDADKQCEVEIGNDRCVKAADHLYHLMMPKGALDTTEAGDD